ncbi:leucine efflux protein LeuE [Roseateles saccharophilus]|uniref:Leucine efflux protein n=1 Tax=Roseateles saccharophilus TaxID=304 RepID=A0A4R3ULD9_ROSSA|nr:leucine efflux protein LeuE [Roseateles saccharophilus]MDG0834147.1 leucine efflux protein LeuE [Roseateles saccharophilus]TCU91331.1 leucine efflux protein [Roseateles saccharophilus]
MFGITDLGTFIAAAIFIILLPGPNSLYVLSVAAQRGVRAGYTAACGVFVGDTVLMTAAAAGGASLLMSSPQIFFVVKMVGAAYLGWVGLQLLRGALNTWRGDGKADEAPRVVDANQPFRKALVVSLLNPKAIAFLLSFFIQFVDPAYPRPALTFLILGSIIQVLSFLYLSTLIFAGARLAAAFRARRRLASTANAGVGALFVGFGAKLATATL